MASSKDFDLAERFGRSDVPMSEHTAVPHSPLPWKTDLGGTVDGGSYILDANDRLIGEIFPADGQEGEDLSAGNAAILVRAVNAHEALVKALQAMLIVAEGYVRICEINGYFHEAADVAVEQARAALAKGETR